MTAPEQVASCGYCGRLHGIRTTPHGPRCRDHLDRATAVDDVLPGLTIRLPQDGQRAAAVLLCRCGTHRRTRDNASRDTVAAFVTAAIEHRNTCPQRKATS